MEVIKKYKRKHVEKYVKITIDGDAEKVKEFEKAIEECYEDWKDWLDWEEQ